MKFGDTEALVNTVYYQQFIKTMNHNILLSFDKCFSSLHCLLYIMTSSSDLFKQIFRMSPFLVTIFYIGLTIYLSTRVQNFVEITWHLALL